MPRFTIIETIVEERLVTAPTAQEALDLWLQHGADHPDVSDEFSAAVEEREVYDSEGNPCEVEDG